MKITGEEIVYDGKFISVKKVSFETKRGTSGIWETVKRKTFGKVVSIFALTSDREVILEKTFRVPLGTYVIELPAGLMDKKGETPKEVIKRELLEETGYSFAGEAQLILEGPFNAGLVADEMMTFFAENVEKVSEPCPEDAEDIKVIKVPLHELVDFVMNPPDGCKVDIKILGVLPILKRKLAERIWERVGSQIRASGRELVSRTVGRLSKSDNGRLSFDVIDKLEKQGRITVEDALQWKQDIQNDIDLSELDFY